MACTRLCVVCHVMHPSRHDSGVTNTPEWLSFLQLTPLEELTAELQFS